MPSTKKSSRPTKEETLGYVPYPYNMQKSGTFNKSYKEKLSKFHKDREMRRSHTYGWQDDTECFLI